MSNWEDIGEKAKQTIINLGQAFERIKKQIQKTFGNLNYDAYVAYCKYPERKIIHLAKHSKKRRIRKKNHDKIMRWYFEEVKQ